MGNFPRELGNFPDVWKFGEFSWEISLEKEFGNFPNFLRESEGVYLKNFENFPPHGNLENFPRELGNFLDVWEFWEFPWKISQVPNFAIFVHYCHSLEEKVVKRLNGAGVFVCRE